MTVEEIRGSLGGENGNSDKFPVGMRVLAVDDDPTCLMLLDGLLRKCQYQVTTTSQARTALKMLRENRNRFDLIISDVHMPDMDGFKLLELVGLEMDLPVIMLSANSDAKMVMKGITHGACDYLVKPVRIEELRNIWQHVIRKKKVEPKNQNKSTTQDKAQNGSGEGGAISGGDHNGKLNRKRKDDEEEGEENGHESDDSSTQKKPRVVWSIELHRKFVAAVNQLGIEKAVPKRILDMMNVEGLTRENVASHLQKYRLYLKRISSVATQQANMVAALGGKDSAYMRIGSLDGFGDYRTLAAGSGRIPNGALSSYPQSGILGRLNTPAGVSLRSLASPTLIQPNHAQNSSHSINNLGKFQPIVSQANQNATLFQGVPTSLELDQLQSSRSTAPHIGEYNSYGALTNPMVLQGTPQQMQNGGGFGNQTSLKLASLKSEPLAIGFRDSPNFLDPGKCNENWQSAVQLSKFSSNSLPLSESFNHNQLPTEPFVQNSPLDFSTSTVLAPLEDTRGAIQCRAGPVGNFVPNMNQQWGEQHKQDQTINSTNIYNTLNSMVPASGRVGPLGQSLDQLDGVCNRKMDMSLLGQSNSGPLSLLQHGELAKSTVDSKMRSNEDYLLEQSKVPSGFVQNNYDSLDDLMSSMIKRDQEGTVLVDGEFGLDNYTFGSCI